MTREPLIEAAAKAIHASKLCQSSSGAWQGTGRVVEAQCEDAARAALSAIEAAGMAVVPVEPDDAFWDRVKFHDGEHSRSGETFPVQRNLHRAMIAATRHEPS